MYDNMKGKRAAIMRAATEVFNRDGFHQAKVEDIAMTAGVGKGTVYEYFSSKAHLYQEIVKESFLELLNGFEHINKEDISPTCKLEKLAKLQMEHILQNKEQARQVMNRPHQMDEDFMVWMRDAHIRKFRVIQSVIDEGMEKGIFRPVNGKNAALMFTGVITALFGPVAFGNLDFDYDGYIRDAMNLALQGLMK